MQEHSNEAVHRQHLLSVAAVVAVITLAIGLPQTTHAWNSADGSLEIHGFADYTHHNRDTGIAKSRFRGQLELSKYFQPIGIFSEISMHGTIRASYDGVYNFNAQDHGDEAGHRGTPFDPIFGESAGLRFTPTNPPPLPPFTPDASSRMNTPWGFSPVNSDLNPATGLPGNGNFRFDTSPGANPAEGLIRVNSQLTNASNSGQFGGGLELWYPGRPCDVDPRGCIDGYMDFDTDDLEFPEFRDDHRWLREIYVDATVPFASGDELNIRIGRQQIVWGRTDLFRVLDQVNPIDFSIQNIYEELEDSRIPQGMVSLEYRFGATEIFDDINIQAIWAFEKFQPNILGQGGQPYSIIGAGGTFRGLSNCWHNGCTVSNFATGLIPTGNLATDFPAHTLGIRQAHVPDDRKEFGVRLEGVFKSVGFSVNYRHFYSQLPSLRAGIPSQNPFLGPGITTEILQSIPGLGAFYRPALGGRVDAFQLERPRDYVPAFDIHFPEIDLVGGSADFYIDKIKSAFRVEFAWTTGEEFADTSQVQLYSESDVIRWVIGWDRPTYIRFLNPNRTFLLSAQVFGQHLLDHNSFHPAHDVGFGPKIGFQDNQHSFIATFLFQGNYMNDRLTPQVITAYDFRAQALVVGPSLNWLPSDNWRVTLGANLKFGHSVNVADDGRTSNPFAPFTCQAEIISQCAPGQTQTSTGERRGYYPLGAFQSGPLGMAQNEDELQILVRYRF